MCTTNPTPTPDVWLDVSCAEQAVWTAYNGTGKGFDNLTKRGDQYVMTTMQWHRSQPFADTFWGSAEDYAQLYTSRYKLEPTQFSAGVAGNLHKNVSGAGLCMLYHTWRME